MVTRNTGAESSPRLASLASRAMNKPESLTLDEIQELGGSVLRQFEPPTVPIRPRVQLPDPPSVRLGLRRNPFDPKRRS